MDLPKGFKDATHLLTISASVAESAANTFTQEQVTLPLDPLNNEVFVVQAINIDHNGPDAVVDTNTGMTVSVSTTSRTSVGTIADANVLASRTTDFRSSAGFAGAVDVTREVGETPASTMPYVGVIATDDFFIQIQGTNNTGARAGFVRLYGYRAKVTDAGVYSALVQSELLS